MPAFSSTSLQTLIVRNDTITTAATNATNALQVICAWPVSGQYGPGSRILYYVLIAACVLARKADWLRNASLAAALLFPAVAAVHGIVLAAIHVDGAVDMDVYGAFQLCSIGILAAPVTVRLSRTYFYDPGRNIIFLWTGLILAGLLSLTVEFFRIETSDCTNDDNGKPIFLDADQFSYDTTCGLDCFVPSSPLRAGAASDIFVIPAPDKLKFETATLLAAACCIPAILSLVSMWNKILKINWKTRFGDRDDDEPIQGTNGATNETMRRVNSWIRELLSGVEIPVFGAAVLAILIIGEMNFFSPQVSHQTEPIASIGQWAPIIGSGLAALGSLYVLLAADMENEEKIHAASMHHCNCSLQGVGLGISTASSHSVVTPGATDMRHSFSNGGQRTSGEIGPITRQPTTVQGQTTDVGNRRKVAKALTWLGSYLGTAAPDRFDDSDFKHGKAVDWPEIPGEEQRNSELPRIREVYNPSRDADGNITPALRPQRSRSGSFTSSVVSRLDIEGNASLRAGSPQSPQSSRPPISVPVSAARRPHASTLQAERSLSDAQSPPSSASAGSMGGRLPQRRDTLEVPSPVHHSHTGNSRSASSITAMADIPMSPGSPAIVVSSDPDTASPTHTPDLNPQATSSSSEPLPRPPTSAMPP